MDLQVELNYNREDGSRPYKFGRPKTERESLMYPEDEGGARDFVPVTVMDGRNWELSLDQHSFQLIENTTSLTTEQFYDQEMVEKVYYKEVASALKAVTGASVVQIYHHQVRNPERNNGSSTNVNTSVQGYAGRIHLDTHPIGCIETFKHFTSKMDQAGFKQGRFVVINAWRNISDIPIQRDHLALLDESSTVKPDDYISGDYFGNKNGRDYVVPQYLLNSRHAAQHRWFYFSNMKKEEMVLFKMFDSDTSKEGRSCFHTAFSDPSKGADVPCRQSIEVRCFLYFPSHLPNTCPPLEDQIKVHQTVFPYNSGGPLL